MHKSTRRFSVLKGVTIGASLLVASYSIPAQQILNLGPLPGVGQITEILEPGNGQGFSGLATLYRGQPVILYDSVWIERFGGIGSPAFRFIRAHEYAHHFRGHVLAQYSAPPQTLPTLSYESELDADCAAVKYLRQVGDSDAIQAGYQIYQTMIPPQDLNGRPGSFVRIQKMNSC
ncbi:hypothetical protein [Serratia sp. OS31]|uniref:hypothetical protein n=1 Tax=Serratia sp. OS31 TaxID=2760844 RepID=UPI001604744E|nr:hypothetical protein [Serratia sp. OS31]MBB1583463.1 hypothetical protein [Serratia sp. OS31]